MIDWTKPLEVIDASGKVIEGATARYLGTLNADLAYPHVLAIADHGEDERAQTATNEGTVRSNTRIRNVAETFEVLIYANIYHEPYGFRFGTVGEKKTCDMMRDPSRIACIRVTISGKVGQFDE